MGGLSYVITFFSLLDFFGGLFCGGCFCFVLGGFCVCFVCLVGFFLVFFYF